MPPVDPYDLGHELGKLCEEVAGLRRDLAKREEDQLRRCASHLARMDETDKTLGKVRGLLMAVVVAVGVIAGKGLGAIEWATKLIGF